MRIKLWKNGVSTFLLTGLFMFLVYDTFLINLISRPTLVYDTVLDEKPDLLADIQKQSDHTGFKLFSRRLVRHADCKKLINGDIDEMNRVKVPDQRYKSCRFNNDYFIDLAANCSNFRKIRHYDAFPVSDEEKEFPIAYSILMYKDVDQAERLLRSIYRPQNVYCFHIDGSSEKTVHQTVRTITRCFQNVFVVSRKMNVVYGQFSRLQADINCMRDLIKNQVKWKYFINLPSQEFPLKTNSEIVKVLKIYNGANDIEGISKPGRMMSNRFKNKTAPPHGVKIIKGSAYGIFSRRFVDYILNDKKAQDILEWSKVITSPDEYYWSILNHNEILRAPGGYWDDPNLKPWLATYAAWNGRDRCHGKFVRGVCVFGVGDLPDLISRKELFANKFYVDYQPLAIDCLEEWIFNRTIANASFDTYYYEQLPFIL